MDVRAVAARKDVRTGGAIGVAGIAAVLIFAFTAGGSAKPSSASTPGAGPAVAQVATRWWSNPAAAKGSHIDESNPGSAANLLVPSEDVYCTMLKQTLAAGRTILPQAKAGDKALVASTRAFIAEIQGVAPVAVADEWKTLAPTLLALVSGGQLPANTSAQAKANASAANAISADAKSNCGVSLAGH